MDVGLVTPDGKAGEDKNIQPRRSSGEVKGPIARVHCALVLASWRRINACMHESFVLIDVFAYGSGRATVYITGGRYSVSASTCCSWTCVCENVLRIFYV